MPLACFRGGNGWRGSRSCLEAVSAGVWTPVVVPRPCAIPVHGPCASACPARWCAGGTYGERGGAASLAAGVVRRGAVESCPPVSGAWENRSLRSAELWVSALFAGFTAVTRGIFGLQHQAPAAPLSSSRSLGWSVLLRMAAGPSAAAPASMEGSALRSALGAALPCQQVRSPQASGSVLTI